MTETGAVGAKFVGLVTPKGFQPHGSGSSSGQQRVTDVFGTSSNSRSAFQNRLQLNCYHSGRSSHVCIEKVMMKIIITLLHHKAMRVKCVVQSLKLIWQER